MMVLGNTNRILIIVGGAIVMHEAYSWQGVFGIILAISGSVWYGYTRAKVLYGRDKMRLLSVAGGLDKLDKSSRQAMLDELADDGEVEEGQAAAADGGRQRAERGERSTPTAGQQGSRAAGQQEGPAPTDPLEAKRR